MSKSLSTFWILIVSAVFLQWSTAFADDYYVQASRNAIVRKAPDTISDLLLRLERGDQLNTVTATQRDRFYQVHLPDGQTGWVSRYVVRLHRGRASDAPSPGVPASPTSDLSSLERQWASFHLAVGRPKGYEVLVREGQVLGYDPRLKIPVWVQYRLTKGRSEDNRFEREDDFHEDAAVPPQARARPDDYASSGYARGHMAPAEDMRWDESAVAESNLLTNVGPQIGPGFNQSVWKTVENRVRGWVKDRDDLTIICGPVLASRDRVDAIQRQPQTARQVVYNVIGARNVAVPTAYFKVIVDARNPNRPDVLAFLVPHIETQPGPEREVDRYLTSVDRIEEVTGLDLLAGLPAAVQEQIEKEVAQRSW